MHLHRVGCVVKTTTGARIPQIKYLDLNCNCKISHEFNAELDSSYRVAKTHRMP